jgi:ubiquinone/menaquinone biosynthesis C-methylase UbiE
MRKNGIKRTKEFNNVTWYEGTGENTGRESNKYDFVSFGSSFNVCDRKKALEETARILKEKKYFTCMWNHRQLDDPIQKRIENIIKEYIDNYSYGTRREDQTDIISNSGLFSDIIKIEGHIIHRQPVEKVIEAWKSHATLRRQVGDKKDFDRVINMISDYLLSLNKDFIEIPYTTVAWLAQKK